MATASKIGFVADWHRVDIEASVKREFGSYAGLARAWNEKHPESPVKHNYLSASAYTRRSALCEEVIAWGLNTTAQKIWPSRYNADGSRIYYRAMNNANTR